MLSKPQHGWTDFSLGKSCYALSYLSNIPLEWLDRAIFGLQTLLPFEVCGYCEPGRLVCTVDLSQCRIRFEGGDGACEVVAVHMLDFCKMLLHDITEHMDDWQNWSPAFRMTKEDLICRTERLRKLTEVKAGCFC